jgi:hypothetical protein
MQLKHLKQYQEVNLMSKRGKYERNSRSDQGSEKNIKKNETRKANSGRRSEDNRSRNRDTYGRDLDVDKRNNDPNWYFLSPELAEQASQLSFQSIAGSGNLVDRYAVPTMAVVALNPCPGVTPNTNNAYWPSRTGFNQSMFKFYTRLSMKSGRAASYAPQDVGMMVLALGEVISMVEYVRRCFGIAFTYNERNRMYPYAAVKCMGIEPEDFFKNQAAYRMRFNTDITQINQIPIPSNIAYFQKCASLYQSIYLDVPENAMAQSFFYVPATTWVLDEQSYQGGTILRTLPVVCGLDDPFHHIHSMDDILDILEQQISALVGSATLNIVYADILNLVSQGEIPMFKFDYLSEGYQVIPEFNANASLQFNHICGVGYCRNVPFDLTRYTTPRNDVYPNPSINEIIYNPCFGPHANSYDHSIIVNLPTSTPSIETRLEALRFAGSATGATVVWNNQTWSCNMVLPDHFCVSIAMFTNVNDPEETFLISSTTHPNLDYDQSQWVTLCAAMSKFNHFPLHYVETSSDPYVVWAVIGDLDYYTTVDYVYIGRLLSVVNQGLFEVRQ